MRRLVIWLVVTGLFIWTAGCANKEMTLKVEKQEKEIAQLKEEKDSLTRQIKDLTAKNDRLKKEAQNIGKKARTSGQAGVNMEQLSELLKGMNLGGGPKPYLGVLPDPKGSEKGYLVGQIMPDSPAQKAGLKAGDIIIETDWDPIKTKEDLENALNYLKPGDEVEIVIIRDGKEIKLTVELGEKKRNR